MKAKSIELAVVLFGLMTLSACSGTPEAKNARQAPMQSNNAEASAGGKESSPINASASPVSGKSRASREQRFEFIFDLDAH